MHLTSKKTKKIDIGVIDFKNKRFKPRYFRNIAEIGLGAAIMKRVNAKNKKRSPLLRYVSGSFQGFLDYKNTKIRIKLDPQGSHIVNLTNLIVANGQYFGRGMRPAPQAKLDDGVFDVVVIKNMNLFKFIVNFPQMYTSKKFLSSKTLDIYQSSSIEVETLDNKHQLHTEVDGENHGSGCQSILLLPRAIHLKI